jgi:hypothetical protein
MKSSVATKIRGGYYFMMVVGTGANEVTAYKGSKFGTSLW